MSQNSIIMPGSPLTGTGLVSAVDGAFDSLATDFSGTSEPGTTWALMKWADMTNDILKIRNLANDGWIDFMDLTTGNILTNAVTATTADNVYMPIKIFNNLRIITESTLAYVGADSLSLFNSSGLAKIVRNISSLNINAINSGVNGLDTGSIAASTWYSVWVIYNPTTETTAGLFSLSSTAPTLPSGYTYYVRIGWVVTNDDSIFYPTEQYGRRAQYLVDSSSPSMRVMANGVAGTYSTTLPTWANIVVTNVYIPSTARVIDIVAFNNYESGTLSNVIVAPHQLYGGVASTTGNIPMLYLSSAAAMISKMSMMLQYTTSMSWVSSAAGGVIYCVGWEDNL